MNIIKNYPLGKLEDFLKFAYEREIYERWLKIYPLMEAGFMPYISFKDYKSKILEQIKEKIRKNRLSDKQIIEHSMEIVKEYEKNQRKIGD